MVNYIWGAAKTIELLNTVQKWESEIKETHTKGRGISKWKWVAAQLFVPDEEWDLRRLGKRCERRLNLLRTNYEAHYLQLTLAEGNPTLSPPPPVKVDAELWKKMKNFFGQSKSPKASKTANMAVARALAASVRKTYKGNEAEDEQSSDSDDDDDEQAPINKGQQLQEDSSSSSSVGSNNLYHDSATETSPTTSSLSSYYEIFSSDGCTQNLDGSPQITGITGDTTQSDQASWSDHDSLTEISVSQKSSNSHNETGTENWESEASSKGSGGAAHDETLAVARSLGSSKHSPRLEAKTESEGLTELEDLDSFSPFNSGSLMIPSAAAAATGSILNSLFNSLKIPSTARVAASITPAAVADHGSHSHSGFGSTETENFISSGRSFSRKKSTGQSNAMSAEKTKGSDSSLSPGSGTTSPQAKQVVKSAAATLCAGTPQEGLSDHGESSGSKAPRGILIYKNRNVSHNLRRLPASLASDEDADHPHPVLQCDDDVKKTVYENEHSPTPSTKSGSKESHDWDPESGNRRMSSSSSSSGSKLLSSAPEHSTSVSGSGGKDDNVNVMVYIKLNNLKLSEAD